MNSVLFRSLLLGISMVLGISCGGDASFAPTAPSGNGVGERTGAVIVGQVISPSTPVTSRSTPGMLVTAGTLATADSASVTVKVTGTNISTTTNSHGQFALTGVPPGEVRLEFTGPGGSATISISGVRVDEEIRITVTLNGSSARVDSEHRNHRGDNTGQNQAEVKGAVSGLTGTCPKLSFALTPRGTSTKLTVTTSESTKFEEVRCNAIKNDMVVEVTGARQGDSIAATKVEGDYDYDDEDGDEDDEDEEDEEERDRRGTTGTTQVEVKGAVSGLTGTCPKLSFALTPRGTSTKITVTTSETTRFEEVRCNAIKNDMVVEVTGVRQGDSIAATKVEGDD